LAILSRLLFALLLLAEMAVSAAAAPPLRPDEAFRIDVAKDVVPPVLTFHIADGYYLYRDRFAVVDSGTRLPVPFVVPPGVLKDDPGFGLVEVHKQSVALSLPEVAAGQVVDITYQGCQDGGICYRPETRRLDVATLGLSSPAAAPPPGGGASWPAADVEAPVTDPADGFAVAPAESPVDALRDRGGLALVLGGFFLFGLLLAFTPCVFPMYPIVAGLLARQGDSLTPRRAAALAAAYVAGLALAFAGVGAFAGWSGGNLQLWLQSPAMTAIVAAVFVLLALSMFGMFEIRLPQRWMTLAAGRPAAGRGTFGGAGLAGFTSALIVGPCVTAPLAGALLYIARGGDWLPGAVALAALAAGKGAPLVVIATFGGRFLPKAGAWMLTVRTAFGFAFLATAVFVASPLIPEPFDLVVWSVLLAAGAVAFLRIPGRGARLAARTASVLSGVAALFLLAGAASGEMNPVVRAARTVVIGGTPATERLGFVTADDPEHLASMLGEGRPTLVYVTAEWCATCRTIDRRVLSRDSVQSALADLQLVKIDVTTLDAGTAALMDRLAVAGPPSMLFFDAAAREVPGTRLVGDVGTGALAAAARAAAEAAR
jgi:thiol:disulfide interchange protein DsbD